MSDLREPLEREARRIHVAPDALDKIHARTHSRQRTHRLVSGLVALTVAATGILVAVRTFTPTGEGGGARPAYQPPGEGRLPVWPSFGAGAGDVAAIDAIQQQVDEGHQPGYLSPEIVAQMFAMEVLEWERSDIRTSVSEGHPARAAIWNPSLPGPIGDVRTILTMERWRAREDGIFVVTGADANILDLRTPNPGQPIPAAEEMSFSGAIENISQRLLGLRLTISVEGRYTFGSYERISPKEFADSAGPSNPPSSEGVPKELRGTGTTEVVPGPDGEFSAAVPIPDDFPSTPGVSVFVQNAAGKNLAVEAFRLGPSTSVPSEPPAPGPTPTSDDATPAPVQVEVADGTGNLHATSYLGVLLRDRGRGTHHGGYSIVATIDPTTGDFIGMETTGAIDRTVISCVPGAEDEAERLRRLFFPNAEIGRLIPGAGSGAPIEIHLGRDFLVTEDEGLAVHNFVLDFLDHRLAGSRAERLARSRVGRYLSPEALRLYESGQGGLSLYGYSSHEVGVRALHEEEDGSWRAVVALSGKNNDTHYESLELTRVSDGDMTQWTVTYAERNA